MGILLAGSLLGDTEAGIVLREVEYLLAASPWRSVCYQRRSGLPFRGDKWTEERTSVFGLIGRFPPRGRDRPEDGVSGEALIPRNVGTGFFTASLAWSVVFPGARRALHRVPSGMTLCFGETRRRI